MLLKEQVSGGSKASGPVTYQGHRLGWNKEARTWWYQEDINDEGDKIVFLTDDQTPEGISPGDVEGLIGALGGNAKVFAMAHHKWMFGNSGPIEVLRSVGNCAWGCTKDSTNYVSVNFGSNPVEWRSVSSVTSMMSLAGADFRDAVVHALASSPAGRRVFI